MDTTKQAKALRQALKVASVSSTSSWIDALNGSGYVIAPASDVLTPEVKGTIIRVVDQIERECDRCCIAPESMGIDRADLVTLREMAS